MPNQAESGTMGGAGAGAPYDTGDPADSGDSGAAVTSAQAQPGGEAEPDLFGTGPGSLAQPVPADTHEHQAFHGRPVSWVSFGFIVAGFLAGGLSIVFGEWPTFWVGVGLVVVGALLATMTDIFEDWY